MPKIELKKVALNHPSAPEGWQLNYRVEFVNALQRIPEGVTVSEMARLLAIVSKLESAADESTIELTDAEFSILKTRLEATKYSFVSREIVEMVGSLTGE